MSRGQDFAELVHRILVNDGRYSLATAASGMGMHYETLYSRVRNRTCFSAEEIRSLIVIVADPRLMDYFLDGTGFLAVKRPIHDASEEQVDLISAAHRLVYGASDVLKLVERSARDNAVNQRAASKLEAELDALERVLLGMRQEAHRLRSAAAI